MPVPNHNPPDAVSNSAGGAPRSGASERHDAGGARLECVARPRRKHRKAVMGVVVALLALGLCEGVLRLLGFPRGEFRGAFTTTTGLWEPNFRGDMAVGPWTYRVEANAHGFRGPPLRTGLDAARTRVVCLGDSVTDGFDVDNDATYPHFLQEALQRRGLDVEVINAARAQGSINKEFIVFRDIALSLAPDVAIVLFVTNDITELGSRSVEQLLQVKLKRDAETRLAEGFVTRTALGERLMDAYLRLRSPTYRWSERSGAEAARGDARYQIAGNDAYEANARLFLEKWADEDARLLRDPLDEDVLRATQHYLEILKRLADLCRARGVRLLLAYMPSYPELYLPEVSDGFRKLLRARAEELDVRFHDLTEPLRQSAREGPLHLAPVDYHPNPRGYRAIAEAIAADLIASAWLTTDDGP